MNLGFYKAIITIITTKGNSFFLPKSESSYVKSSTDMIDDKLTIA